MNVRRLLMGTALAATALLVTACTSAPSVPEQSSGTSEVAAPVLEFVGPNGEEPGALDELTLSDDEITELRDGGYTAAFVWHTTSEFVQAVEDGARAEFEDLGIEVVATTQADFDPAVQANNLESTLALDPDIIVTIAVDPTSAAASFKLAVDSGTKIAVMTTPPAGWKAGEEFVSIVTEDLAKAGKMNAELLGEALNEQGQVAYLYHDADFWFTNQRDQAFKSWLMELYPGMEIVAEEGFTDEARTQEIAAALIARNPELRGIYVPWATAAQGVVAALRDSGRSDVKVVTNDLDATLAADMMRDGNVVGLVGNGAIDIGSGLAIAGAYGLLEKSAPALVASLPIAVTADNLEEAWLADYGTEPPTSVTGG